MRRGFFILWLALAVLFGGVRPRVASLFADRPLDGISILEGKIASHATLVRGAIASVDRGRPRDDGDPGVPLFFFAPVATATPSVGPAAFTCNLREAPSRSVSPYTPRAVPTARGPPRGARA